MEEIQIVSKYDFELSKGEIKKIFMVYNECFYDWKCSSTKLVKKAQALIGSSHVWRWYLAYSGTTLIGIASYVYDISGIPSDGSGAQVNVSVGENVCNVGVVGKFRRRGVAKCLMEAIVDDYGGIGGKDLVVEVLPGSPHYLSIMRLYVGLGFDELEDGKFDTEKSRYLILKCSDVEREDDIENEVENNIKET